MRALRRPCCTYQPPISSWAAKFRAAGAKYPAVLQYDWPPTSGLLGSISLLHDWKYFDRLTIRTQAAILPGLFPITFGSFPLAQTSCSGVVLFLVISVRFITTFIIYYYTVYIFFFFLSRSLQFYDGLSVTREGTSRSSSSASAHTYRGSLLEEPLSFRSHLSFLLFSSLLSFPSLRPPSSVVFLPSFLIGSFPTYSTRPQSLYLWAVGLVAVPLPPSLLLELRPGISTFDTLFISSFPGGTTAHRRHGRQFSPQCFACQNLNPS